MVDVHITDDDDSDFGKRPPSVLIGLPDELAEWANNNQGLIRKVLHALKDSYADVSEDKIWETIAETASPEWKQAHTALLAAEKEMDNMNHPMRVSLGSIGQALDSDETSEIRDRHSVSLADFTIINEGLRMRPDLSNLFNVLLVQKRMVDQSTAITRQTQRASRKLTGMLSLREDFAHAARPPSFIRKQFRASMRRLLSPIKKAPAVARNATNVIVPWAQRT